MNETRVEFKIYDLLKVHGEDLPSSLVAALKADYGHFMGSGADSHVRASLAIKPISRLDVPAHLFRKRKSYMEQSYVLEHEKRLYAVLLHSGRPDCILTLQAPYTLYFTNRSGCANAVLDMLFTGVDLVLRDSVGALLCKGAVVVRDGRAVVLTGVSGAGKTSILMHLLHDGWSYLSDNTFILYQGKALCFRRHLVMHRYHLNKFDYILGEVSTDGIVKSFLRKGLSFLLPYLPNIFQRSQKINRLANPYIRVEPKSFQCDLDEVREAPVTKWISLAPGDRFASSSLSEKEFIARLEGVLDLTHSQYNIFRRMSAIYGAYSFEQDRQILETNVGGGPFLTVGLSAVEGFQEQYCRLKEIISSR